MKHPIVYQDGIRIVAVGPNYGEIRYGISRRTDGGQVDLLVNQAEARELAAALTWIISEVDAAHGRESFKPASFGRHAARPAVTGPAHLPAHLEPGEE